MLTWYIQLMVPDGKIWPFDTWGWTKNLYPFFFKYRIQIGTAATIFVIIAFVVTGFLSAYRKRRSLFNRIFTQIFEEKLHSNYEGYRLTLFYPRGWLRMIFLWVRRTFLNGFTHLKKGCFWVHFLDFPVPWKKYMAIEYRMGHPHETNSTTYFKIPNSEDEFDGFASYVWYRKTSDNVTLPDISDISIRSLKNLDDISGQRKKKIIEYMKKGKVKNFNKLRMIHRLPIHLWGSPLVAKSQDIGAVLILDSVDSNSEIFNTGLNESLLSFSRLLETVIGEY